MSERDQITWHSIKNERGLLWMARFLSEAPYNAFTEGSKDRQGMRICLVGDRAHPEDGVGLVRAKFAFRFSDDELADKGQLLLNKFRKAPMHMGV